MHGCKGCAEGAGRSKGVGVHRSGLAYGSRDIGPMKNLCKGLVISLWGFNLDLVC